MCSGRIDLSDLQRVLSGISLPISNWKSSVSSKRLSGIWKAPKTIERKRYGSGRGMESNYDAGIQSPIDEAEMIWEDSVRWTLLRDLAVLLAMTYSILFPNLINASLPVCKRWKDVLSATFQTLRNALKKVSSKRSRGPHIVSNGLSVFTSASKLAVGMVLIGNTPAVGAVRAMAPELGALQAEGFEKWSNFWFGVVACVGTLVAMIALLKSFNCRRRHSFAGTSTAITPTGAILNRAAKTLTILRSRCETEFREVVVARLEEEGAFAA